MAVGTDIISWGVWGDRVLGARLVDVDDVDIDSVAG